MSAPKKRPSFCYNAAGELLPYVLSVASPSQSPTVKSISHTDDSDFHVSLVFPSHLKKRVRSSVSPQDTRSHPAKRRRIIEDDSKQPETPAASNTPVNMALLPPVPDLIPLEDDWCPPPRQPARHTAVSRPRPHPHRPLFSSPVLCHPSGPRRTQYVDDGGHRDGGNTPDINVMVVPSLANLDDGARQQKILSYFAGHENIGRKYVMTPNGDMIFRPLQMKCTHCCRYFKKTHDLYQHIRTHQNHTQCPHCTKRLTCMATFVYHVRTHTGEKPYYCPLHTCNFRNAVKYNLKVHLASRRHGGKSNLKKYAKVLDEDVCEESLKKRKDDSVHELGSRRSKKRRKLEEQNKAAADAAARHHALAANLTNMPYSWPYEQMSSPLLFGGDRKWLQDVKFNPNTSPTIPTTTTTPNMRHESSVDMKPNVLPFSSPQNVAGTSAATAVVLDVKPRTTKQQEQQHQQQQSGMSTAYPQRFSSFPLLTGPPLFQPIYAHLSQPNRLWPPTHNLISSPPIPPIPPVQSYTSFLSNELLDAAGLRSSSSTVAPQDGQLKPGEGDDVEMIEMKEGKPPKQEQKEAEEGRNTSQREEKTAEDSGHGEDLLSLDFLADFSTSKSPSVDISGVPSVIVTAEGARVPTQPMEVFNSSLGFSLYPPFSRDAAQPQSNLKRTCVASTFNGQAFHLQPDDENVVRLFASSGKSNSAGGSLFGGIRKLVLDEQKEESSTP